MPDDLDHNKISNLGGNGDAIHAYETEGVMVPEIGAGATTLTQDEQASNFNDAVPQPPQRSCPALLAYQFTKTVAGRREPRISSKLRKGAVKLYLRLDPQDAIDSILARQAVILNNVAAECFDMARSLLRSLKWVQGTSLRGAFVLTSERFKQTCSARTQFGRKQDRPPCYSEGGLCLYA
jgi:hypothetical protein